MFRILAAVLASDEGCLQHALFDTCAGSRRSPGTYCLFSRDAGKGQSKSALSAQSTHSTVVTHDGANLCVQVSLPVDLSTGRSKKHMAFAIFGGEWRASQ